MLSRSCLTLAFAGLAVLGFAHADPDLISINDGTLGNINLLRRSEKPNQISALSTAPEFQTTDQPARRLWTRSSSKSKKKNKKSPAESTSKSKSKTPASDGGSGAGSSGSSSLPIRGRPASGSPPSGSASSSKHHSGGGSSSLPIRGRPASGSPPAGSPPSGKQHGGGGSPPGNKKHSGGDERRPSVSSSEVSKPNPYKVWADKKKARQENWEKADKGHGEARRERSRQHAEKIEKGEKIPDRMPRTRKPAAEVNRKPPVVPWNKAKQDRKKDSEEKNQKNKAYIKKRLEGMTKAEKKDFNSKSTYMIVDPNLKTSQLKTLKTGERYVDMKIGDGSYRPGYRTHNPDHRAAQNFKLVKGSETTFQHPREDRMVRPGKRMEHDFLSSHVAPDQPRIPGHEFYRAIQKPGDTWHKDLAANHIEKTMKSFEKLKIGSPRSNFEGNMNKIKKHFNIIPVPPPPQRRSLQVG